MPSLQSSHVIRSKRPWKFFPTIIFQQKIIWKFLGAWGRVGLFATECQACARDSDNLFSFRCRAYDRGDFPVVLTHTARGCKLVWKVILISLLYRRILTMILFSFLTHIIFYYFLHTHSILLVWGFLISVGPYNLPFPDPTLLRISVLLRLFHSF